MTYGLDCELRAHLLKRKGPRHEGELHLPSIPAGLEAVLTPRVMMPCRMISNREREHADVLGSATARQAVRLLLAGLPAHRQVA